MASGSDLPHLSRRELFAVVVIVVVVEVGQIGDLSTFPQPGSLQTPEGHQTDFTEKGLT